MPPAELPFILFTPWRDISHQPSESEYLMAISASPSVLQINKCWRAIALYTRVGLIDARALREGRCEFRGIPPTHYSPLLAHLTACFHLLTSVLSFVMDGDLMGELVDEQDAYLAVNRDPAGGAETAAAAVAAYARAAVREEADSGEGDEEDERPLWTSQLAL